ncbi:Hypothetical protein PHPALM_7576 [Phytophthora palmivora]|uniref:Uncharacterized protein n=1 Tax=Phytophthora palmivora TaxID=4796 RepID=A0A2P4YC05_9STRA|nr:Hypothetical protein PHPALM_7576 [Phytophthora palmivora]
MRCTKFYYATTVCIRYAVDYFDPRVVADRFSAATVHLIESKRFLPSGSDAARPNVCLFRLEPKRTIEFTGTQSVNVIQSTTLDSFRASVFLCAFATRKKMSPLIVFAGVHGTDVHDELRADRSRLDWDKAHYSLKTHEMDCVKRL